MPVPLRVVVVGGGVSGLTVAYHLARRLPAETGAAPSITLLEAGERLGGKVTTRQVGGIAVDTGPDALLVRDACVRDLLVDLGLADALSRPTSRRAYVWARGALRPLPAMSLFGVPDNPFALVRTGILTLRGAVRAAADLVLPRRRLPADPSIAELLRPRLGAEVFDLLVEPMLGGVHAGRAAELSARSAVPDVHRAVVSGRSAYLSLRERRRRASAPADPARTPPDGPPRIAPGMVPLRGGLQGLTDAIAAATPGAELRTGALVAGLDRAGAGTWPVRLADGEELPADVVVLAAPAHATARLLLPHSAAAADALDAIPYAGVATVYLAYRTQDVGRPLDGTGFLVPPSEDRFLVGCTWTTAKWQHHAGAAARGVTVVRCAVGRHGDRRGQGMDDDAVVDAVHLELTEALDVRARPVETTVQRWPGAMPQYTVGHEARLAVLDAELAALPGVHLTGAGYRGVGLSGCITQADTLATRIALAAARTAEPVHAAG
ncbi:MAG: protoporphyrinogen oxidase [Actinobacteria bacterium]|nr:protoporphyrinogen oxidase [Actinomycetota bacterium]